ncbi:dTDP-4-dehydrorhamnose reductase [Winogradskyella helgolandensis]|uniref:dTDP-4-dehydrorhamnose reductase n=1 Tax=Winogradskyella helgolandensis TaxID=2697010 RepID=UPI0015CA297E|nr:dTDP-4-dehydrorhamnose reductase [Winogradskyella helgolandensis]
MTILVTGKSGQLGSEIQSLASKFEAYQFIFTGSADLDISKKTDVLHFFENNAIDVVINCAAYTAVDKAESDIEHANAVNHLGVVHLIEACKKHDAKFIHVSTDYVYDGMNCQPYVETDPTQPKSVYGETKLEGENALIASQLKDAIIIRTSWVYSSFGNNFVKTMLRLAQDRDELGVVGDQIGTPTYAKDLAEAILHIVPQLNTEKVEIYHYSNEGVCSWFDFAHAIFEIKNKVIKLNAIGTDQYPTPANRPSYSVLSKQKIKNEFQLEIPYWRDALKTCLEKL